MQEILAVRGPSQVSSVDTTQNKCSYNLPYCCSPHQGCLLKQQHNALWSCIHAQMHYKSIHSSAGQSQDILKGMSLFTQGTEACVGDQDRDACTNHNQCITTLTVPSGEGSNTLYTYIQLQPIPQPTLGLTIYSYIMCSYIVTSPASASLTHTHCTLQLCVYCRAIV